MQVLISLLWLLAMTAGPVYAQGLDVQRLDITDFGIYALDREISGRDRQGIILGTATNIQHTSTQRTVPAQIGVTFGFRYRIVGKPEGATIPLKKVIIYPAPGLQTPSSSSRVRKAEFKHEAKIGETNTELYTLEDQFELVPGTWMLEMWLGNRKLASQPFRFSGCPRRCRRAGDCCAPGFRPRLCQLRAKPRARLPEPYVSSYQLRTLASTPRRHRSGG